MFGSLKTAYREQVERLYRGGANTVGKQHFTSLYSRARVMLFTPLAGRRQDFIRLIQTRFSDIQKPQTDTKTEPSPLDGPLRSPVTSEALTSPRNQIEQDIHVLDSPGIHRVQKLANAAEKKFAECTLLLDENRLLFEQNNESRSRLSTRSTVIGKAEVMSYDDIVETQRKRDAKDAGIGGGTRRAQAEESYAYADSRQKVITPYMLS